MKINNRNILKIIFGLKGYLKTGKKPGKRIFGDVEITAFKNDRQAAVTISADLELSWAFRARSQKEREIYSNRTRENMPILLKLAETYRVPITWATVGHLFLEKCNRNKDGIAHAEMPRPVKNERWNGDWYKHDPCTNFKKDPMWYSPDIIDSILKSKVGQEIGTHSFSHIDFSQNQNDRLLVKRELEACIEAMANFSLKPRTLVFPSNKMGYECLDVISNCGIIGVRHRDRRIRISYPERTKYGIYKIYESMNLRTSKHYDYLEKVKVLVGEAIKRKAGYHIWFHPSDDTEVFTNEFQRIVEFLTKLREEGRVWITTMDKLSSYCEGREKTKFQVEKENEKILINVKSDIDKDRFGTPEITVAIKEKRKPKVVFYESKKVSQKTKSLEWMRGHDENSILVNIPTVEGVVKIIF